MKDQREGQTTRPKETVKKKAKNTILIFPTKSGDVLYARTYQHFDHL